MDREAKRPYVVSADVAGIMRRWARESGYQAPTPSYFAGITEDLHSFLQSIFPEGGVDIIQEKEIRKGIRARAALMNIPIVSLDRVYVDPKTPNVKAYLDITRAVDENFQSIGNVPRPGRPSYNDQLRAVADVLEDGPIAVIDDVLFSGASIVSIASDLQRIGHPVIAVIVGVAIQTGIDRLEKEGIPVIPVRTYQDGVIDEICQRDTLPGFGGTAVIDKNGDILSAPYLYPFGDPVGRASIPESKATEFSHFCIEKAIEIWKKVEHESRSSVPTNAVPRRFQIPENPSIVSALRKVRSELADLASAQGHTPQS